MLVYIIYIFLYKLCVSGISVYSYFKFWRFMANKYDKIIFFIDKWNSRSPKRTALKQSVSSDRPTYVILSSQKWTTCSSSSLLSVTSLRDKQLVYPLIQDTPVAIQFLFLHSSFLKIPADWHSLIQRRQDDNLNDKNHDGETGRRYHQTFQCITVQWLYKPHDYAYDNTNFVHCVCKIKPNLIWLEGPGIESRWGARFSAPVQTGLVYHPASYTMGTGYFLGGKRPGRGFGQPHPLAPRLKKEKSTSPLGLRRLFWADLYLTLTPVLPLRANPINNEMCISLLIGLALSGRLNAALFCPNNVQMGPVAQSV